MIYVGWDSEYLAVIGLPLFIFFVESVSILQTMPYTSQGVQIQW